MALRARLRRLGRFENGEPNIKRYLDLVSIGTVADMVPLVDENRVLVSYGLKELDSSERPGLKALKLVAGIKPGRLDSDSIAFGLAPRINAAGRLESAKTALRLFLSEATGEAERLARMLDDENASRRRIEGDIQNEALGMVEEETVRNAIVLSSATWHPGVVGIVASRIAERFTRPTILIAVDDEAGVGKGSVRGIKGVNVLDGLKASQSLLERYGGHKAAAGLTVRKEKIAEFSEAFTTYFNNTLTDDDLVPEVELDAVVSLEEIDARCVTEMERLSPFGRANRRPLLALKDANIVRTEVVGRGHLSFMIKQNGCARRGIGFGLADMHPLSGGVFDVAFYPYMDEWQGTRSLKLRIKDLQPSSR
jgi:single-stranded-DNA-specific exonuclease